MKAVSRPLLLVEVLLCFAPATFYLALLWFYLPGAVGELFAPDSTARDAGSIGLTVWLAAAALCGVGGLIGLYAIVRSLGWGTAPRLRRGSLWVCIALGVASLSVPAYVTLSGEGDPLMFALLVSVPIGCLAHLLFMARGRLFNRHAA